MRRFLVGVVKIVLPLVVVVAGVMGAVKLYETGPSAQRRDPQRHDRLVHVQEVSLTSEQAMIHAMGTVMPSQQVDLQPRVSGEIVKISPSLVPGGRFEKDEFMVQIDPVDYELAVQRARSRIAEAQYELKLERGHQEIAQREWELLDAEADATEQDRELALRKPHLERAEAALKAAQAELREAELDLERTTIRAPFGCIVMDEEIDLGAQVTVQTQLATLVGTDAYWVRASVPVDELSWIHFPDAEGNGGSPVMIRQQLDDVNSQEWQGRVLRIMGDLEPQGRMARVLISVKDPLSPSDSQDNQMPLIVGAYVNVVIEGRQIENVYAIPRTVLRDGRTVWVMDDRRRLDIRDVVIVWQNRSTVLVRSGLTAGDRLVISDIPAPVQGMGLALGNDQEMEATRDDRVVLRNGKEGGDDASH
jgi:RND family efflux transporter MFP subunit